MARGSLITIEGPDGVGKTSLAEALTSHLETLGIPSRYLSFPGRQPGTLGRLVNEIHHHAADHFGIRSLNPISRQLLHVAAQIDELENFILPAMRAGQSIVLDRFWWSVWVYGMADGANPESLAQLLEIERRHWSDFLPDVAILIDRESPFRQESGDYNFQIIRGLYK